MEKDKIEVSEEGVHTISVGGDLKVVMRRDPLTGKHLWYFLKKTTSAGMAEFMKANYGK